MEGGEGEWKGGRDNGMGGEIVEGGERTNATCPETRRCTKRGAKCTGTGRRVDA